MLLAAAAWRRGFRLYAGAAAAAVFLLLSELPSPRALWLVAGSLAVAGATHALAARDLVPSHRDGLKLARAVALLALYVAVNYALVDHRIVETILRRRGRPPGEAGPATLLPALLASALFPVALLAWGIRARQRGLLALGVLAAAASLATIRLYHHVAPLWVVLAGGGALLAGASLLVERRLRSGPEGERGGFTAAPLYHEGRREQLLPVAAGIAAAPAARALPAEPRGGVAGGGGGFGGAGAGGAF